MDWVSVKNFLFNNNLWWIVLGGIIVYGIKAFLVWFFRRKSSFTPPNISSAETKGPESPIQVATGQDIKQEIKIDQSQHVTIHEKSKEATTKTSAPDLVWDEAWILSKKQEAIEGLRNFGRSGYIELRMTLPESRLNIDIQKLQELAKVAPLAKHIWPLGKFWNDEGIKPRPEGDSIIARVNVKKNVILNDRYDYWALRRDGTLYSLRSLWEERIRQEPLFSVKVQINRIAEILLYAFNLYSGFNIPLDKKILIRIGHGGLKDRILFILGGDELFRKYKASVNEAATDDLETSLDDIKTQFTNHVQTLANQLFAQFDFYKISRTQLIGLLIHFFEDVGIEYSEFNS